MKNKTLSILVSILVLVTLLWSQTSTNVDYAQAISPWDEVMIQIGELENRTNILINTLINETWQAIGELNDFVYNMSSDLLMTKERVYILNNSIQQQESTNFEQDLRITGLEERGMPPVFDSSWIEVTDRAGTEIHIPTGLGNENVLVDVMGKKSLDSPAHQMIGIDSYQGWTSVSESNEWPGDEATSIDTTPDGGFVIGGSKRIYHSDAGFKSHYFWIAKYDWAGTLEWNYTYGYAPTRYGNSWLSSDERSFDMVARYSKSYIGGVWVTRQDGYVMVGESSGTAWLLGTRMDGSYWYNYTYTMPSSGWSSSTTAYGVIQNSDLNFTIVGKHHTGSDSVYVVKTDYSGNVLWNRSIGGNGKDAYAVDVAESDDGGVVVLATVYNYWGPLNGTFNDVWLIKLDPYGNEVWNRTITSPGYEYSSAIIGVDGGFAIAALKDNDAWLIKVNEEGYILWNMTYSLSGNYQLSLNDVIQTNDGGFALAVEGDGSSPALYADLIKTDYQGVQLWNASFMGEPSSLVQVGDGSFALIGVKEYRTWVARAGGELGLVVSGITPDEIILYRGRTDQDWNYVRVRLWETGPP